jgi:murein DD-endopeptidase MepM/ murein hydrolase activator NlpD
MIKRCLATLLLVTSLLHFSGTVFAACSCDRLCIKPVESTNGNGLLALNSSAVPLTFSIEFNADYYIVAGPSLLTLTLPAGESLALPVRKRNGGIGGGRPAYRCQWTVGNQNAAHNEEQLYLLPYESGRSYRVLQGFGSRFSHTGTEQFAVDFKMDEGTPVHAARDGIVALAEESHARGCWSDECAGEANYIVILHDDETTGEYYHLQQNGVLVETGDRIVAGQKIGLSGNTGHSALPHLHFGVYRAIDHGKEQSVPFRFLSADGIVDLPRRGGLYVAVDPQDADETSRKQTAGANRPATSGF